MGGDQKFFGWSKGGGEEFFSVGQRGGPEFFKVRIFPHRQRGDQFFYVCKGKKEKIGDQPS